VDEDGDAAPVEFGEQRLVARIAEVDAANVGLGGDSVAAELVDGVLQLLQGRVDVGQRQGGEVPESAGVGAADLRSGVVDVPGQRAGGDRSPKQTPGEEMDRMEVAMPHWSISSRCRAAPQVSQPGPPSGCRIPASFAAWT